MAFKRRAPIILLQTETPRCFDKVLNACVLQELLHAYLTISAIKSTNLCGCFGKDKKIKTKNRPFILPLLMKNKKKNNHLAWPARLFSRSRTPRCLRPQSLAGGSWTSSLTLLFPGPLLLKVKVFHYPLKDFHWEYQENNLTLSRAIAESGSWKGSLIWLFQRQSFEPKNTVVLFLTLSKAITQSKN